MTVQFHTLGCKLNQVETEAIAAAFREQGPFTLLPLSPAGEGDSADLVIVNTCTVTGKSEQKARRIIRQAERTNPGAVIIVTGCYAEMDGEAVRALGPQVVSSGQEGKVRLLDLPARLAHAADRGEPLKKLIEAFLSGHGDTDPFRFEVSAFAFHSRPFLKIQEGCDNLCAYCRVRLARGASLSLSSDEVVRRVTALEQAGHREVVLTGVNIDSWQEGSDGLPALIRKLLRETSSIRFRISSLNPGSVTSDFADAVADNRVCPHFHLSVQSGSRSVLKRMLRNYGPEKVLEGIGLLRQSKPDPFLAADIITGFPGESDAEWDETVELLKQAAFSGLHVFPFSARPDTAAARMTPKVPERIAGERAAALIPLTEKGFSDYIGRWIGQTLNPLAEAAGKGVMTGISENYLNFPFVAGASVPGEGSVIPSKLIRINDGFRFEPL